MHINIYIFTKLVCHGMAYATGYRGYISWHAMGCVMVYHGTVSRHPVEKAYNGHDPGASSHFNSSDLILLVDSFRDLSTKSIVFSIVSWWVGGLIWASRASCQCSSLQYNESSRISHGRGFCMLPFIISSSHLFTCPLHADTTSVRSFRGLVGYLMFILHCSRLTCIV